MNVKMLSFFAGLIVLLYGSALWLWIGLWIDRGVSFDYFLEAAIAQTIMAVVLAVGIVTLVASILKHLQIRQQEINKVKKDRVIKVVKLVVPVSIVSLFYWPAIWMSELFVNVRFGEYVQTMGLAVAVAVGIVATLVQLYNILRHRGD